MVVPVHCSLSATARRQNAKAKLTSSVFACNALILKFTDFLILTYASHCQTHQSGVNPQTICSAHVATQGTRHHCHEVIYHTSELIIYQTSELIRL